MITISNKFTKNLILPLAVAGNFFISETKVFTQYKDNKKPAMIEIIDKDNNTIPEEYILWEKENDKSIAFKKYTDKNQDGEVDSVDIFIYHPKYNKVFIVEKSLVMPIEIAEMKMAKQNLLIGKNYSNCKEGYFKKNIYDYIKK